MNGFDRNYRSSNEIRSDISSAVSSLGNRAVAPMDYGMRDTSPRNSPTHYEQMRAIERQKDLSQLQQYNDAQALIASSMAMAGRGGKLSPELLRYVNDGLGYDGETLGVKSAGFESNGDFKITVGQRDRDGNTMYHDKVIPRTAQLGLMANYPDIFGQGRINEVRGELLKSYSPMEVDNFEKFGRMAQDRLNSRMNDIKNGDIGFGYRKSNGLTFDQQKELAEARKNPSRFDSKQYDALQAYANDIQYNRVGDTWDFSKPKSLSKQQQQDLAAINAKRRAMIMGGEVVNSGNPGNGGTPSPDAPDALRKDGAGRVGAVRNPSAKGGDAKKKSIGTTNGPDYSSQIPVVDKSYTDGAMEAMSGGKNGGQSNDGSSGDNTSSNVDKRAVAKNLRSGNKATVSVEATEEDDAPKYTQSWSDIKQGDKPAAFAHKAGRAVKRVGGAVADFLTSDSAGLDEMKRSANEFYDGGRMAEAKRRQGMTDKEIAAEENAKIKAEKDYAEQGPRAQKYYSGVLAKEAKAKADEEEFDRIMADADKEMNRIADLDERSKRVDTFFKNGENRRKAIAEIKAENARAKRDDDYANYILNLYTSGDENKIRNLIADESEIYGLLDEITGEGGKKR